MMMTKRPLLPYVLASCSKTYTHPTAPHIEPSYFSLLAIMSRQSISVAMMMMMMMMMIMMMIMMTMMMMMTTTMMTMMATTTTMTTTMTTTTMMMMMMMMMMIHCRETTLDSDIIDSGLA